MWLLNVNTLTLEAFYGNQTPKYAILSHRWQQDEFDFQDVKSKRLLHEIAKVLKIAGCCVQASKDGLSYVWIDTCCIDKTSSAELAEAINSMFKWYKQAEVCYSYLYDVQCEPEDDPRTVDIDHSDWFTRGWTLQELIAPRKLIFFDHDWKYLGSKAERWTQLQQRTRIPKAALLNFRPQVYTAADIFCWAAYRQTTRPEDRAYSLFGLFDIQMPLLYGEGERALSRLNEELKRLAYDSSLSSHNNHNLFSNDTSLLSSQTANSRVNSVSVTPSTESTSGRVTDVQAWHSNVGTQFSEQFDPTASSGIIFRNDAGMDLFVPPKRMKQEARSYILPQLRMTPKPTKAESSQLSTETFRRLPGYPNQDLADVGQWVRQREERPVGGKEKREIEERGEMETRERKRKETEMEEREAREREREGVEKATESN